MKKSIILVGAGLANVLLGYRLKQRQPEATLLFLEKEAEPRLDRTWSFYESDVTPNIWQWLSPLASKVWDGYEVRFPTYERRLASSRYASLRGADLLKKANLEGSVRFNAHVQIIKNKEVVLSSGERLCADAVVVGRGFHQPLGEVGFQKFYGLQILLKTAHGLTVPTVMDTTVSQSDGFRFIYLLPWDERRLLVEDTYYSDHSALEKASAREKVLEYIKSRGWEIEAIEGEECSALPIPLFEGKQEPLSSEIGVGGNLFHPVTGYSVPWAAQVAENWDPFSSDAGVKLAEIRKECNSSHAFYRGLNRMLFMASHPSKRRKIFEKFYLLPEPLVQRFYAGSSTRMDKIRILSGKPPVPVVSALRALFRRSEFV
jgi:lycopene beta-cyclase